MKEQKTIAESRAVLSDVMLPGQANPAGNVHGGEIMKMMDTGASVTAMRHAKANVVTVRVDELMFYHPIYVGQLVICESELVFVGRTSMEVKVTVRVEDMLCDCEVSTALTAFFTFVALDGQGRPCSVPRLRLETDEQRAAFELGRQRHETHKALRRSAGSR